MHDRGEGRAASFCMYRNLNESVSCSGGSICYCLLRIGCISQLRYFLMTNLKLSCSNMIELFCLELPLQRERERAVAASLRHNDGTYSQKIKHAEGVPSTTTQPQQKRGKLRTEEYLQP